MLQINGNFYKLNSSFVLKLPIVTTLVADKLQTIQHSSNYQHNLMDFVVKIIFDIPHFRYFYLFYSLSLFIFKIQQS